YNSSTAKKLNKTTLKLSLNNNIIHQSTGVYHIKNKTFNTTQILSRVFLLTAIPSISFQVGLSQVAFVRLLTKSSNNRSIPIARKFLIVSFLFQVLFCLSEFSSESHVVYHLSFLKIEEL